MSVLLQLPHLSYLLLNPLKGTDILQITIQLTAVCFFYSTSKHPLLFQAFPLSKFLAYLKKKFGKDSTNRRGKRNINQREKKVTSPNHRMA